MPAIYPCTECGNEEPERATASAISESSPSRRGVASHAACRTAVNPAFDFLLISPADLIEPAPIHRPPVSLLVAHSSGSTDRHLARACRRIVSAIDEQIERWTIRHRPFGGISGEVLLGSPI